MTEQKPVPTYQQALEAAGLDREVGMDALLDQRIVLLEWTPDTKVVPQTRQRTQGYLVEGYFEDSHEHFKVFMGGNILVKELTALVPPFSTVIRQSGQSYRFS